MTLEEFNAKTTEKENGIEVLIVPFNEAWKDENGTGNAKYKGKDVYLAVKDNEVRERVFRRSIFRYMQKINWHPDIIKTDKDVGTEEDSKAVVLGFGMFKDYRVYLQKEYRKIKSIRDEYLKGLKIMWKYDREFLRKVLEYLADEAIGDVIGGYAHFADKFEKNVFGIKISDIENDVEAMSWVSEIIFDRLKNDRGGDDE